MPYAAEICRTSPSCFLFLIDQSRSMAEPTGGHAELPKSYAIVDGINRLCASVVASPWPLRTMPRLTGYLERPQHRRGAWARRQYPYRRR
jgi:hypothetical protein